MTTLTGPQAEALSDQICARSESKQFETKRVSGKMVGKALEVVCAFANTEGGILALGVEDFDKAKGRARLFGLVENPEAVDELSRKLNTQFNPPVTGLEWIRLAVTLRDGTAGEVALLKVPQSAKVHSIVDDGTWTRLERSNRELSAGEITELSFARGVVSAESQTLALPFELVDTGTWRLYCETRGLTQGDLRMRMENLALARRGAQGELSPTRAAVLLFADDPNALMAGYAESRASIRVFHYSGTQIEHGPAPNLRRAPKSISGPLIQQINNAHTYVLEQLATGFTMAASGFKTVHRYPERVVKEAITNAVIHRDYRMNKDIVIRLFDNRIEVESPGVFPGNIRPSNIARAGSRPRNSAIATHLREFPNPPNVDAGEGVPMMFSQMRASGLFPPHYRLNTDGEQATVTVTLLNEERPTFWEQVSDWMDRNGAIGNRDLCEITGLDTLKSSKLLARWVEQGLLEPTDSTGKRNRRYLKPVPEPADTLATLFSTRADNKPPSP